MADIKRFTGFIAIDGSTHDSLGKATSHTKDVKIKTALEEFAKGVAADPVHFTKDDRDNDVLYPENLPDFLAAYRVQIMAAYNQTVVMREPRPKKATVPAVKNASVKVTKTPLAPPAPVTLVIPTTGVKAAEPSTEEEGMTLV